MNGMVASGPLARERPVYKRFSLACIVVAGMLSLALAIAYFNPPHLEETLPIASMAADGGFGYTARLSLRPTFGYLVAADSPDGSHSSLRLHENGQLLGAAHTLHSDIRERGQGRYSHWNGHLWFSTSDSSDPRANGRTYSVSTIASIHSITFVVVGLIDLLALVIAGPWLLTFVRLRRMLGMTIVATIVIIGALAASGVLGRINESAGAPKDLALVIATLMHALLGCVILLVQWMAGAGLARLALPPRRATVANVLLLGFALSLPLVAVLSVITLSVAYGFALAGVVLVLSCLPLRSWRPAKGELAGVAQVGILVLPFAVGFGCWMGLNWHGPTESLGGSPSGDLVYYSTAIVSLATQFYPYLNLGYEPQPFNSYFNMLFPALGAALGRVVALDPFLFIAASGGALFILSLGLTLHLYVKGTGVLARGRHVALSAFTLVLAIIVANRSPYWVISSIPVIHAVPLTVVTVYWARKRNTRAQLMALALAIIGSALSKVVGAAVLAPFALAMLLPRFLRGFRSIRILVGIATIAAAAYAAIVLYQLGFVFGLVPLGPSSFGMIHNDAPFATAFPDILRDCSAVILAVAGFLLADWLVASVIAFGFLLFLVYPFLFYFNFICASIILGLVACDQPERLWKHRMLVVGGLLLSLPSGVLIDSAGPWSGLFGLVCVSGTVWIGVSREQPITRLSQGRTSAAALLLLCFGLVAVARGNLILDSQWQSGVLTPQVRQIWLAARERTPPDALIFTDQTGMEPTLLSGWNTYAFIGARQIFVSNLFMNSAVRLNPERASEILAKNDAVLNGTLSPPQLPLRGHYSSYFAVVSNARKVPPQWVKIFENKQYSLYRILTSEGIAE
jgi:hypothetical protein